MPDINKYRIAVMVLAVAVVALIIVLLVQSGGTVPSAQTLEQQLASTTVQTTTQPSGAPAAGAGMPSTGGTAKMAATGFTIRLQTPNADETWTIGQQNTVSWNRAAGVSGQILTFAN